jgi:hypothetical protein
MREKGLSYQAICDIFDSEGVPTPAGSPRWWRSHVSRLLHTRSAFEMSGPLRRGTEARPPEPVMRLARVQRGWIFQRSSTDSRGCAAGCCLPVEFLLDRARLTAAVGGPPQRSGSRRPLHH